MLRMETFLSKQEGISTVTLAEHRKQMQTVIDDAIRFCDASPLPDHLHYLAEVQL